MIIYDLPCMDNRKSFYGKAKVIEHDDGTKELLSYDTIVCKLNPGAEFVRLWCGYSATTQRHVNSFLRFFGCGNYGGKAFWDACNTNETIQL